jgi:tetratricopeptide (TPR) repeat protein
MKQHESSPHEALDEIKKLSQEGASAAILSTKLDQLLEHCENFPQIKADALILKGQHLQSTGSIDAAMECFAQSTQMVPSKAGGYIGLAQIAYLNHSHEEALMFYKKALAHEPNNPEILLGIGLIHRRAGLNAESLFWIGKSLSIDPHNPSTLIALTQACLECASPSKAISLLEKSREIAGEHPSLLLALGQLYVKTGKTEEGKVLLEYALSNQFSKSS